MSLTRESTSRIEAAPVLVASDNPELAGEYARALESVGFRVRQGSPGAGMLRMAWKHYFSLAVIDGRSGFDLAIEIAVAVRFRSRQAPLVLLRSGLGAPGFEKGTYRIAPIRTYPQPPLAPVLVRDVCGLMGLGDETAKGIRRCQPRK
jgi:hypothetical protein